MFDFLKKSVIVVVSLYIALIILRIVFTQLPGASLLKNFTDIKDAISSFGHIGSKSSTGTTTKTSVPTTTKGYEKSLTLKINKGEILAQGQAFEGTAPFSWFYENTFTVKFVDDNGKEIGRTQTHMTLNTGSGSAPFIAQVIYNTDPGTQTGYAVFMKANITGKKANDAQFVWPITFPIKSTGTVGSTGGNTTGGQTGGTCKKSGCSGQICSTKPSYNCSDYKPEYACYTVYGKCETQSGGCGWNQTPELLNCLAQYSGTNRTSTSTTQTNTTTQTSSRSGGFSGGTN